MEVAMCIGRQLAASARDEVITHVRSHARRGIAVVEICFDRYCFTLPLVGVRPNANEIHPRRLPTPFERFDFEIAASYFGIGAARFCFLEPLAPERCGRSSPHDIGVDT